MPRKRIKFPQQRDPISFAGARSGVSDSRARIPDSRSRILDSLSPNWDPCFRIRDRRQWKFDFPTGVIRFPQCRRPIRQGGTHLPQWGYPIFSIRKCDSSSGEIRFPDWVEKSNFAGGETRLPGRKERISRWEAPIFDFPTREIRFPDLGNAISRESKWIFPGGGIEFLQSGVGISPADSPPGRNRQHQPVTYNL